MLSADKNVTLTEFQIQTLQIREKELNYFVSLYNSISGRKIMLSLNEHKKRIQSLITFRIIHNYIASISADGMIIIWENSSNCFDYKDWKVLQKL